MASPLDMPKHRPVAVAAVPTAVQTDLAPHDPSKTVRPGIVTEIVVHDGIVKAKHLKPGQKVRAFLHGEPRGGEREVGEVTRIGDGAQVHITWASGHPEADYKAAYRFFDESLKDTTSLVKRPGFVPVA